MADTAEFEVRLIDKVTGGAKKAGASVNGLIRKMMGAAEGALGMGKKAEAGGSMLKGALSVAIGIGIEKVTGAVFGLGQSIVSMAVGAADSAQRAGVAFNLLAKHGASGAKLFEHAQKTAVEMGLDVADTTKTFQKFLALQFDPAQATALIKMGSDMQALGSTAEQVQGIMAQLGQIKAKGKLQGEELVVLSEAGVSTELVFNALAKQMGVSMDEVKKRISKGAIDSATALNAIGDAILHKTGTSHFGEAGQKMATSTLSGMMSVLKGKAQMGLLKIGQKIAPALMGAFSSIFDSVGNFLDSPAGATFIDSIAAGITGLANVVKMAVPFVKEFLFSFGAGASDTLSAFGDVMKSVFGAFSSDGAKGLGMAKQFGTALGQLAAVVVATAGVFIGMFAGITMAATALWTHVSNIVTGITNTIGRMIFAVTDTFANIGAIFDATGISWSEKLFGIGKMIIMGLLNGIKAVATAPVDAVKAMGSSLITSVKSVLGIASPSKEFAFLGQMSALGFQQGMNDNGIDTSVPAPSFQGMGEPAATGGGNSVQLSLTQHFHIDGSADPVATADAAKRNGLDGFAAALEEAGLESAA